MAKHSDNYSDESRQEQVLPALASRETATPTVSSPPFEQIKNGGLSSDGVPSAALPAHNAAAKLLQEFARNTDPDSPTYHYFNPREGSVLPSAASGGSGDHVLKVLTRQTLIEQARSEDPGRAEAAAIELARIAMIEAGLDLQKALKGGGAALSGDQFRSLGQLCEFQNRQGGSPLVAEILDKLPPGLKQKLELAHEHAALADSLRDEMSIAALDAVLSNDGATDAVTQLRQINQAELSKGNTGVNFVSKLIDTVAKAKTANPQASATEMLVSELSRLQENGFREAGSMLAAMQQTGLVQRDSSTNKFEPVPGRSITANELWKCRTTGKDATEAAGDKEKNVDSLQTSATQEPPGPPPQWSIVRPAEIATPVSRLELLVPEPFTPTPFNGQAIELATTVMGEAWANPGIVDSTDPHHAINDFYKRAFLIAQTTENRQWALHCLRREYEESKDQDKPNHSAQKAFEDLTLVDAVIRLKDASATTPPDTIAQHKALMDLAAFQKGFDDPRNFLNKLESAGVAVNEHTKIKFEVACDRARGGDATIVARGTEALARLFSRAEESRESARRELLAIMAVRGPKDDALDRVANALSSGRFSIEEILKAFPDQSAVREAQEAVRTRAEENLQSGRDLLQEFVRRNPNGTTTDATIRTDAIRKMEECNRQRTDLLKRDQFGSVLDWMKAVDAAQSISEAKSPQEAAKSFDALVALAGRNNPVAKMLVESLLQNPDDTNVDAQISRISVQLRNADMITLGKVRDTLGWKCSDQMNEMRVNALIGRLDATSSLEDWHSARQSLEAEITANNEAAIEWLAWARTNESLVKLQAAGANWQAATVAMNELIEAGNSGSAHARRALSMVLIANTDATTLTYWTQIHSDSKPLVMPNLEVLANEAPEQMKALHLKAAQALQSQLTQDGSAPSRSEYAAVAIALANAQCENNESLSNSLAHILAAQTSEVALVGIYDAIRLDAPGAENLTKLLLNNANHPAFRELLNEISAGAETGHVPSLQILAAIAGGACDNERLVTNSAQILERAAMDPALSGTVMTVLMKRYAESGDTGSLLATLGRIAEHSGTLPDSVHDCLRQAVRRFANEIDSFPEGSPEHRQHDSAVKGLASVAAKWTEDDAYAITRRMTPDLARALASVGNEIPASIRTQILQTLEHKLTQSAAEISDPEKRAEKVREQVAIIEAMGALAPHAATEQIERLTQFGNNRDSRLSESEADLLEQSAGKALLRMLATNQSKEVREQVWQKFEQHNWKGIDNQHLRNELRQYVEGNPENLRFSETLFKLTYDVGLPRPLAGVFKDLGMAGSDEQIIERTNSALKNYDEQTIRSVLSRITLYNSLPPEARMALSGSLQPLDPRQIMGQLANNALQSGDSKFLLKDLESEVATQRQSTLAEVRELNTQLSRLEADKKSAIGSLTSHTAEGVTFVGRLSALVGEDPFGEFSRKQRLNVEGLKLQDRNIAELSAQKERLMSKLELLSLAGNTQHHTELMIAGRTREADLLALEMWRANGSDLEHPAPSVWRELNRHGETPSNYGAMQRLHKHGLTESDRIPDFANANIASQQRLDQALNALKSLKGDKIDSAALRTNALRALDAGPAIAAATDQAAVIGAELGALQQIFQSGMQGLKYEEFVVDARQRAARVAEALSAVTPDQLTKIRTDRHKLEESLKEIKDEDSRQAVRKRIDALKQVESMFGEGGQLNIILKDQLAKIGLHEVKRELDELNAAPTEANSSRIQQLQKTLDYFKQDGYQTGLDNEFDQDTWLNFCAQEGPVIAGAIAGGVVAAVAITGTLGTATPLVLAVATAAAGTAGGMAGGEATSEFLYQGRSLTGLNIGKGRSIAGEYVASYFSADNLTVDPSGRIRERELVNDVLVPYVNQLVVGTATTLTTMGAGALISRSLNSALRPLVASESAGFVASNMPTFRSIAAKLSGIDQLCAANPAHQAFAQRFRGEFLDEVMDELKENVAEQALSAAAGKLAESNQLLGILSSCLVAGGKGVDFQVRSSNGHRVITVPSADIEAITRSLVQQGLHIEQIGGAFKIRTLDGATFVLAPQEMPAAEAAFAASEGSGHTLVAGESAIAEDSSAEDAGRDSSSFDMPAQNRTNRLSPREVATATYADHLFPEATEESRLREVQKIREHFQTPVRTFTETPLVPRPEFQGLTAAQIKDKIIAMGLNFDEVKGDSQKFNEIVMTEGSPREMVVFKVGHLEIVMPKDLAILHSKKRELMAIMATETGSTIKSADRYESARVELKKYADLRLPEELVALVNHMPDPRLVQTLSLSDRPSTNDLFRTVDYCGSQLDRWNETFRAAATATYATRTITFYPGGAASLVRAQENMFHEWAHILETASRHNRAVFETATRVEAVAAAATGQKPYAPREYGHYNTAENFTTMAEVIFEREPGKFHAMIAQAKDNHAKAKILVEMQAIVAAAETAAKDGLKPPYLEQLKARFTYAKQELLPDVRTELLNHIEKNINDVKKARDAIQVLTHLGDTQSGDQIATLALSTTNSEVATALFNAAKSLSGSIKPETLVAMASSNSGARNLALKALIHSPSLELQAKARDILQHRIKMKEYSTDFLATPDGVPQLAVRAMEYFGDEDAAMNVYRNMRQQLQHDQKNLDAFILATATNTGLPLALRQEAMVHLQGRNLTVEAARRLRGLGDAPGSLLQAVAGEILNRTENRANATAQLVELARTGSSQSMADSLTGPSSLQNQWKAGRIDGEEAALAWLKNKNLSTADRASALQEILQDLSSRPDLATKLLLKVAEETEYDPPLQRAALQALAANPPLDESSLRALRTIGSNATDRVAEDLAKAAAMRNPERRIEQLRKLEAQATDPAVANLYKETVKAALQAQAASPAS